MSITASLSAARTSGVAPLAVFFDATGTTATDVTRPFHELEYHWNFGDTDAGNWQATDGTATGHSKNTAIGAVAAHVYETPGTYTVTLTVRDSDGTEVQEQTTITVSAYSGATHGTALYVGNVLPVKGANGVPNDAYTDVLESSDFDAVINTTADGGVAYKWIYFKRGDTFISSTVGTIDATGPGRIGAYGTGAEPIVQVSAASVLGVVRFGVAGTMIEDWRVTDLTIDPNGNTVRATGGVVGMTGMRQILIMNLDSPASGVGCTHTYSGFDDGTSAPGGTIDQVFFVENTHASDVDGQNTIYVESSKLAVLGNHLKDANLTEMILRPQCVPKGVISHNIFSTPLPTKHALTLRGGVDNATEFVIISDNKIVDGPGGTQAFRIGPSSELTNQIVRDVIVERNWLSISSATGSVVAMTIEASEITVRANIFNMTGAAAHQCIGLQFTNDAGAPEPDNVHIYNNTGYSGDTDNDFRFISIPDLDPDGTLTNIFVKNNLAYAPNDTLHDFESYQEGSPTTATNSTDAQIGATNPFDVATPSSPADFALSATSYAKDTGTAVAAYIDFMGRLRTGLFDIGALELGASEWNPSPPEESSDGLSDEPRSGLDGGSDGDSPIRRRALLRKRSEQDALDEADIEVALPFHTVHLGITRHVIRS